MRSVRRFAARCAAVTLVAAASLGLAAGAAWAEPSITVDPTGELAATSTLTVSAEGFTPGTTVVIAECRPDDAGKVAGPGQCANPTTGSSAVAVADDQGAVKGSITITVGEIRTGVTCAGEDCVVAAISTVSAAVQATARITLTGQGTSLPAATATPTPTASPSASPTPSPTASAAPEPTTEPPAPVASTPASNAGGTPRNLARTGPEDAARSLLLGLAALQVGLIVAVRQRRAQPVAAATGSGRHSR